MAKKVKKTVKKVPEPVHEAIVKPEPVAVTVPLAILTTGARVASMKQCKACGCTVAKVINVSLSNDTTATYVQYQCMMCGSDIRD